MRLNRKALEAACAAAWGGNHWPRVPNAERERHYHGLAVAAYFDALAEQGIRLVDVREVAEWLRSNARHDPAWDEAADAIEARFATGSERVR